MSLKDDIANEKNQNKTTKWQLLKKIEADIIDMLESNISIKKQVEIILKNKDEIGIEKLDIAEYRKILIKYFNYQTKNQNRTTIVDDKIKNNSKTTINPVEKNKSPAVAPAKSAKDILSEPINLI